jgi:hypothetical protein
MLRLEMAVAHLTLQNRVKYLEGDLQHLLLLYTLSAEQT